MTGLLWFIAGVLTGAGAIIYMTYLGIDITDEIEIELFNEEDEEEER